MTSMGNTWDTPLLSQNSGVDRTAAAINITTAVTNDNEVFLFVRPSVRLPVSWRLPVRVPQPPKSMKGFRQGGHKHASTYVYMYAYTHNKVFVSCQWHRTPISPSIGYLAHPANRVTLSTLDSAMRHEVSPKEAGGGHRPHIRRHRKQLPETRHKLPETTHSQE